MGEETKKPAIQWHPAFYAGIQIEFSQEKEKLEFENEHQLGTKPKQIDVLIIKKESEDVIQKNIGRIFRKHNIIEYKSPDDYLSIDDFYQVYGYACFYKEELLTAELLEEENFWLRYLTNDLKTVEEANKILSEYEGNQKEKIINP